MKLRSGNIVGKQSTNAAGTVSTIIVDAAHALVSFATNGYDTPVICAKKMNDLINPLLTDIGRITGENQVIRRMSPITHTFRQINQCDMDHMIRNKSNNKSNNPISISRFALVVLHKACDLMYHIVDYVVRERGTLTPEEKRNFVVALTELSRTKRYMIHMIRGWIVSADPIIGTALLNACKQSNNENLTSVYGGCVVNDTFINGYPPFSMDNENNDGWAEDEVYDHCFVNREMRGFIWANCTREYQVGILENSGEEVFGKRDWELVEDTIGDINRLEDESEEMHSKIDANQCDIHHKKMWLNDLV